MVFAGFVDMKSVRVDRYGRTDSLFYFVMSYLNSEPTSGNFHISSDG